MGRDGSPLDLHRSFRIDDDPDDIGHFLAQAGYLHIEGMFTEAEMDAVSADLDDAVAAATFDDGQSWWARLDSGDWYAARILGFNQKSPALRESSPRTIQSHLGPHRRRVGPARPRHR